MASLNASTLKMDNSSFIINSYTTKQQTFTDQDPELGKPIKCEEVP